jgi:hypothetical protein
MILGHRSDNKHNPVPPSEIKRHELLAMGAPLKQSIGGTRVGVIHGNGYRNRSARRADGERSGRPWDLRHWVGDER